MGSDATAGDLVRQLRGERGREEFIRDIYDQTGIYLSHAALARVETGAQPLKVPGIMEACILAYPETAVLFLGRNLHACVTSKGGALFTKSSEQIDATDCCVGGGGNDTHKSGD
jgi:hypothetical protein